MNITTNINHVIKSIKYATYSLLAPKFATVSKFLKIWIQNAHNLRYLSPRQEIQVMELVCVTM